MGERGPLPQSRAARVLSMNASRRPLPPKGGEPEPAAAVDDEPLPESPPSLLSKVGRLEWRRLQPILERRGHWKARFHDTVVGLCVAKEDWTYAKQLLDKEGRILQVPVLTATGDETGRMKSVTHPAWKMKREAKREIDEACKHLGLTPASEPRVRVDGGRKERKQGAYERRQK